MTPPKGIYHGEHPRTFYTFYKATGEFRKPKRGEHYLSGAVITAYRAPNDLSTAFWIAERTIGPARKWDPRLGITQGL